MIDHSSSPIPKPTRKRKKSHSRKKRTVSRRRMVLDLDGIARAEVFERDGSKCIRCPNADRAIQWAHVLSRRHLCLRWEADNAMTLCAGCHLFWHGEPALAVEWFVKTFPQRWERIKRVLQVNPKVNVKTAWELAQRGLK